MRVLALDSTTPHGSLALVGEDGVLAEARVEAAAGHSRWLLPALDALLLGLELRPEELDAFAVTTGPGSFTGLRVGLSTVQGLALASGRPCVGLSALDVLAWAAPANETPIVAVLDAFRGEVYWAVYDNTRRRVAGPQVGTLDELLTSLRREGRMDGVAFVGELPERERSRVRDAIAGAVLPAVDPYLAALLGRVALGRLRAGEASPASELRPLYVRGVDIRPPRA